MAEYLNVEELLKLAQQKKAEQDKTADAVRGVIETEFAYWQTVAEAMGLGFRHEKHTGAKTLTQWMGEFTFHLPTSLTGGGGSRAHSAISSLIDGRPVGTLLVLTVTPVWDYEGHGIASRPFLSRDPDRQVTLSTRTKIDDARSNSPVRDREAALDQLQRLMKDAVARHVGIDGNLF